MVNSIWGAIDFGFGKISGLNLHWVKFNPRELGLMSHQSDLSLLDILC